MPFAGNFKELIKRIPHGKVDVMDRRLNLQGEQFTVYRWKVDERVLGIYLVNTLIFNT